MSKRGQNIYKRKDGRWEGRYKNSQTDKYIYMYAKTYGEVKKKMSLYRPEQQLENKCPPLSFSNVCDEWLLSRRNYIKESTYVKYYNSVENHIKPFFKEFKLNEITLVELESFAFQKITSGNRSTKGGLSISTIRALLKLIDNILWYSVSKKYISKHVSSSNVSLPKSKELDTRVLSKSEQLVLTKHLLTSPNNLKLGILLCLYTGLRIGEVCALKWSSINLNTKTIYVEKTIQRIQNVEKSAARCTKIIETIPKTHSSIREIPIPNFLIVPLKKHYKSDGLAYFLTGESKNFIEPRTYENIFKRYITQSKIKDVNFHALRHTFATNCIEVGFEIKSLSEILGHANVQMTLNRYVHPTMEIKRKNMNLLNF